MTTDQQIATSDIAAPIRTFISENMRAGATNALNDTDNIFEQGFVTSLFAMRLLEFIEVTFAVEVPDDAITLENFSTVDRMTELVTNLQGTSGD